MTPQKIPATVITGFLGAGKTTTIRHHAGDRQRQVAWPSIINEFGDLGIDGELLKGCGDRRAADDDDILELANGCICCTVADDFLPTMQALIDRRPRRPIISSSRPPAWPCPKPLDQGLQLARGPHPSDRRRCRSLSSMARRSPRAAFAHDERRRRRPASRPIPMLDHDSPLAGAVRGTARGCADLVVLNKTDLLEDGDRRSNYRVTGNDETGQHAAVSSQGGDGASRSHRRWHPCSASARRRKTTSIRARPITNLTATRTTSTTMTTLTALTSNSMRNRRIRAHWPDFWPASKASSRAHDILRIKGFAAVAGKDMPALLVQAVGPRIQHLFRPSLGQTPRIAAPLHSS